MSRTTTGFTITQAELVDLMRERFGDDPNTYAFQCPNCKDIASTQDFIDAGLPGASLVGQHCIGRPLKEAGNWNGRGCNWVAYGLLAGPWRVVMPGKPMLGQEAGPEPDTHIVYSFPLAPGSEEGREGDTP